MIADMLERLRPLHEEIILQVVAISYGIKYRLSLDIKGLSDIIVGAGLGFAAQERNDARTHLISELIDTDEPQIEARL